MLDCASRVLASCLALLALAAGGCAEARRDDSQTTADASARDGGSDTEVRDGFTSVDAPKDAGRAKPAKDAGAPRPPARPDAQVVDAMPPGETMRDAGSAAGSGALDSDDGGALTTEPPDCRGPGVYSNSPTVKHVACCDGYNEFLIETPGHDVRENQICIDYYQLYACIRGSCGDGQCEKGEDEPCSCPADCPNAVWETPVKQWSNGLTGLPSSCSKEDITAKLKDEGSVTDCGDLPLDAALADRQAATTCARTAYAMNQPFQVFWRIADGTEVLHIGVYAARHSDGTLVTYQVGVDGIDSPVGATAGWLQCTMPSDAVCAANFDDCLACDLVDPAAPICHCFPEGPRSNVPAGTMVEVECMTAEEWATSQTR